jgi:hypothetical protein
MRIIPMGAVVSAQLIVISDSFAGTVSCISLMHAQPDILIKYIEMPFRVP